jgi:hypothetical protein
VVRRSQTLAQRPSSLDPLSAPVIAPGLRVLRDSRRGKPYYFSSFCRSLAKTYPQMPAYPQVAVFDAKQLQAVCLRRALLPSGRNPAKRSTSRKSADLFRIGHQARRLLPTSRLPSTNPANFLELRFLTVSGLPAIWPKSENGLSQSCSGQLLRCVNLSTP